MADINTPDKLEAWLLDKPREIAVAFAVRIALRVFPLVHSPRLSRDRRNDLTIRVARALFISRAAANYPSRDMTASAANARAAAADTARNAPAAAANSAYASGAAAQAVSDANERVAIDSARTAFAYAATGFAAYAAYAYAYEADAEWMEQLRNEKNGIWPAAAELLARPLWRENMPRSYGQAWDRMKSEMSRGKKDWDIWIDWYENRLTGKAYDFSLLPVAGHAVIADIAMEADAFWARPPAEINADIKARLMAAWPPKPTLVPASVNPVWRGNRLVQDDTIDAVLDRDDAEAMLEALAEDFSDMASEYQGVANISGDALAMIVRTSEQVRNANLSRSALFRLLNRLGELQNYSDTVRNEWSPERSARYHALTVQFDILLKTFPEIRRYIEALPKPQRSLEQVQAILAAEGEISDVLRNEDDAQALVDSTVSDALDVAAQSVNDDLGPWIGSIDRRPKALNSVENQLAGLNNVLGQIVERAGKSYRKEANRLADDIGPETTTLVVKLYERLKDMGKAGALGTSVTGFAAATHLDVLAGASVELGCVVAALSYIYISANRGKK